MRIPPPCPSDCLLPPSPGSLDLSGLSFESRDMEGACFADSLLHGASFKDANLQVSVGAVGSHVVRMPRSRARTPRALRATPRERSRRLECHQLVVVTDDGDGAVGVDIVLPRVGGVVSSR